MLEIDNNDNNGDDVALDLMLKVIAVCQVYNMMVLYLISTPRKGSSRGREVRTISIFFFLRRS